MRTAILTLAGQENVRLSQVKGIRGGPCGLHNLPVLYNVSPRNTRKSAEPPPTRRSFKVEVARYAEVLTVSRY